MAVNIVDLAFDEAGGTLTVVTTTGLSSMEPTQLDIQEHGVMFDAHNGVDGVRHFVPWSNVTAIYQVPSA